PRGQLEQDVLLAREVAEEGGPADLGLGDHVADAGAGDAVRLVAGERGPVDAVALLGAALLGGRQGQAAHVVPGVPVPVADETFVDYRCFHLRSHIEYSNGEIDTPYGFGGHLADTAAEESGLIGLLAVAALVGGLLAPAAPLAASKPGKLTISPAP